MTSDPESMLFDFAASNRAATNEEEKTVTELHAALGTTGVPLRLRRPPTFTPKPNWHRYMHVAATFALVVAIATAGFFAIREQSGTPSSTEVPEVVLGLAGQDASPSRATCDPSGDVPIFSGLDASPIDGPAVLVNLDGEMKLICDGEETLLADSVRMAIGTETPHVLEAMTDEGVLILNIATGERLLAPLNTDNPEQTISITSWGQWAILPSTDDNTLASIYNLETFSETPVRAGETRIELASIFQMIIGIDNKTIAIAITSAGESDTRILEGIFIASADGTSRFVETSEVMNPRQMAISQNGENIAITSYEGTRNEGTTTVTLINGEDGTSINSWEIGGHDRFIDLVWTNDSSALLFTDGTALYKVTSPDTDREVIFAGEQVQGLVLTQDDNVIALSHAIQPEAGPWQPKTTIINLETGDETTLDGRDMWAGSSLSTKRTTLVLADSYVPMNSNGQASGTYSHITTGTPGATSPDFNVHRVAVDAVTGEPVGEINYTDPDTDGFSYSSWGTDRDVTVVAFSPDSMWKLVDENGNPILEQIPAPPFDPETDEEAVRLSISPDGYLAVQLYGEETTWIMLPGTDEWIEVDLAAPEESEGVLPSISFIIGDD